MSEVEAENPLEGQNPQPADEPVAAQADSEVMAQPAEATGGLAHSRQGDEEPQGMAAGEQEEMTAQPDAVDGTSPDAGQVGAESAAQVPAAPETPAVPEAEVVPAESEAIAGEQAAAGVASDDEAAPEAAGQAEAQPAQGEADDGRHWYVIHCYSGYENKVRHNLEQRIESMGMKDRIFDVVVPTEEEIEVKDGKRRTVERRVFPGYILVQMLLTEESWYVVRNTPGVTGFVGMGNEPTPLRPEEVAQIVRRMEAEAPRVKVTYKAGQKVRIIDGPFNDFIGTVDDIDMERAKVRVMVSFFGRETPVELDFLQVEKA
jgi:transcriptional antiterminator NusG